ncbi:MAG: hypothetical protein V1802_00925 [Candidatus Aenigmatarchaeota archaeon]
MNEERKPFCPFYPLAVTRFYHGWNLCLRYTALEKDNDNYVLEFEAYIIIDNKELTLPMGKQNISLNVFEKNPRFAVHEAFNKVEKKVFPKEPSGTEVKKIA